MTNLLATAPPDFDDVPDLDGQDHACMREVAEVLARFGRLDRFDLALAHRHFDLAEDEVLIETNDPSLRTLMIRPYRRSEVPEGLVVRETQWQLTIDGPVASSRCRQACFVDLRDRHLRRHHYVRGGR